MPTRPVAGSTFTFEIDLVSQANTKLFQTPPTIAAGDFKRSINGAAFANLDNLPTVTPSGTAQVQIVLSASETTSAGVGGRIKVDGVDASGAEWCSISILLFVHANDTSDVATAAALQAVDDFVDTEVPAILAAVDTEVAALVTAVGLLPTTASITTLQTSVDDLPTNAELATSQAAADDATLAAIAALSIPTAAAIATAVWASGTRTLTSFGTLIADIWANVTRTLTSAGAGGATAAEVWQYATRTLTSSAAEVAAAVSGSDLLIVRAVTFSATLTGLTIPATWDAIYFSVKRRKGTDDNQSVVQVVESNPSGAGDGLVYVNKAAAVTASDGSLTVNQGAGTIEITLEDNATILMVDGNYYYDIKVLLSDSTSELLTEGEASVVSTVTEAID